MDGIVLIDMAMLRRVYIVGLGVKRLLRAAQYLSK